MSNLSNKLNTLQQKMMEALLERAGKASRMYQFKPWTRNNIGRNWLKYGRNSPIERKPTFADPSGYVEVKVTPRQPDAFATSRFDPHLNLVSRHERAIKKSLKTSAKQQIINQKRAKVSTHG